MAVALIVAAGSGERLGADRPKAFVLLAGRPMVEWSVEALTAVAAVERIVVALPPGHEAPAGTIGVRGGVTRSHSVKAGLAAAGSPDAVIVHDAARPLAPPELFERALEELEEHGCDGVVAAARVTDTIKEAVADGTVRSTLDRSRLWAVQTPQAFRCDVLRRALAAPDEVLASATDDAWLVERIGGVVRILEWTSENLKVTLPADLSVAERALGAAGRC